MATEALQHRILNCASRTRLASVVMTLLIALAFSTVASASNTNPAITVLVFNFKKVPDGILAQAENEAGRILRHAGVDVTWQACSTGYEPCQGRGRVFALALTAGPPQNRWLDMVSGQANVKEHLAIVYCDYLPRIPGENITSSEKAVILGSVIVHELGHLLIGDRRHSIGGIMQAEWDVQQTKRALMGQLFFLPEEAKLMRQSEQTTAQQSGDVVSALTSH